MCYYERRGICAFNGGITDQYLIKSTELFDKSLPCR